MKQSVKLLVLFLIIAITGGACGTKKPEPVIPAQTPSPLSRKYIDAKVQECIKEKSSYTFNKYHIMKQGETLYRISRKYGVSVGKLIELNNIEDHTDIEIGRLIRIPGSAKHAQYEWPLKGRLTSKYGKRGRRLHSGIDISADKGTHIKAVADGLVVKSSNRIKGYSNYGRVVEIYHGSGITSLYAHNKKNLVKKGTCVRKGQSVAEVGSSGNATGNHLHLEIRKDGNPVNPLIYLKQ
ncbi:MAG: LysM peptidoglycan-binding domain-containing M23 family metallopeptidase [Candidatus Dadabacteria bacterium]|nr:LysM peptidoglycan-binding domain-containing M23 family metallopeptidase [Candidatus Dadabacteria bacterium]NIS09222.1 LysM peptidoglycan-binding domain-containing M23 family metallopeptidase [Candidatus Dadabacteria bacterium]NIV42506.1 peptidoglycan DD-metalloendopeptidase family protein [Candidatus Dadabacteria bacterium]NIY22498.1 peptidoglycan DD-metalloendopeptidase family protein [Candidatus Dadabacteria bacterium]